MITEGFIVDGDLVGKSSDQTPIVTKDLQQIRKP